MLSGVEVRLNCDFFKNRKELESLCNNIIFTGPIDEFFEYKYGALEYRTVRFESEVLELSNYQGNAVVNYTDDTVPYTRIIEHKHFEFGSTSSKTIISREYSTSWKPGDEPYYPVNNTLNNDLFGKYKEDADKAKNVFFGGRLGLYKYYDMDKIIALALEFTKPIEKKSMC